MDKELRKLLEAIEEQGFHTKRTANGHHTVRTPDGQFVTVISGTPSDKRGTRNALAALRRAGFIWPR